MTEKDSKALKDKLYQAITLLHEYFMEMERECIREELKSIRRANKEPVRLTKENPHYVSMKEAMKILGVSRQTIYRCVKNGLLQCYYLGEKPRFSKKSLEECSKMRQASGSPYIIDEMDEDDNWEIHGDDIPEDEDDI